ncbi:MAG: nodulation protein NfeD [Nitrospiraceae bacterium]|nr:MAG: nodulation protein NfeD [Nitrospiraceae bacterium]
MKKIFFVFLAICAISFFYPLYSCADIFVIKVNGVVNPVMSEFISKNVDMADRENSEAIVIELDTPGGLDTSMRSIVKKINSSKTPVIVYVSPGGARAASAGVFITMAAHIASMAPGTNIGAAHPVGVGGKMDKTMSEKVENDAAAYIISIAEQRKRNADWAEKAVRESLSITESEALKMNVIDHVSPDLTSLLEAVDNTEVETSAGKRVIKTNGVNIAYREMSIRHKVLDIISDPNIAYLLMLLGFYGIFFELTNPGAIFPGAIGTLALILALYSFQTLPVNYAGFMLIVLGVVLFILEIKVTSFGMLTIGGIISMTIGSIMLFDSPLPFFSLSLKVILPAVIITALFFSLTVYLVVKAYKRRPVTGAEGLVGLTGKAKTDIHDEGQVFIHGEIWSAWSEEPIQAGEAVVVEKVDNLILKVRTQDSELRTKK